MRRSGTNANDTSFLVTVALDVSEGAVIIGVNDT